MSTLNINNYEEHRPMSMIYQNLEIVPEGTADRTAAVLIGSQGSVHQYETQKGLILIKSIADIKSKLRNGVDTEQEDNVLAACAEIAFVAGGGEPFYCISTTVNGVEDWDSALNVLKNNDRTMFVCPLTSKNETLIKVSNTCLELSRADEQKWKRCYIGLEANTFDKDGTASNTILSLDEDARQRTCLIWSAGAKSAYATGGTVNIDGVLTPQQVAAGITALRASILPQQGLSRRTLSWIYSIPEAYTKFNTQSLNNIATQGVLILTQDDEDSDVYVRHQLTNDLKRGILYYEDSVGVNADTICYGLKDLVKPYIGQRNNTQETLVEIKNRVADYLLGLTSTGVSLDARRIGPQIKEVDLNSLIVRLDDNFKDRVIISVDVVLPVPLNQVHVHLNAFVSLNDTVESA